MDNIQKAILTVLGVAGLIAMLVPSENPIDPAPVPSVEADQSEQPSNIADTAGTQVQSPAPAPQSVSATDVTFQMGQPSIDGNPIQPDFGMPYGASNADANQTAANGNNADDSPQNAEIASENIITAQSAEPAAVNAD
jgi:hypothetical protein